MNHSLIAVRYAKALFSLSVNNNQLDIIYRDLNLVDHYLKNSSELFSFLTNPVYKPSQKKKFIHDLLAPHTSPTTINFLNVVIDQNRESMIKEIIIDFGDLYRANKNIRSIKFISATPLSESFEKEIKDLLSKSYNSEIELNVEIKQDLLGGFILMIDGKLMDASLSSQIKKLKKQLIS